MNDAARIVRKIQVTEKGTGLQALNKYLFEVRRDANKIDIKRAMEAMFEVDVVKVNTSSVSGKVKRLGRFQGRRASWKKAIVTLAAGQTIDFFEGA